MVGKLQSNKAKKAVKFFDYIHSLDNPKLATKLWQYEKDLNKKDVEKKKEAKATQERIQFKELSIKKLCNEAKELYGSVTPTEISKILKENFKIDINPSQIQPLKEIKSIGTHKVIINLHSEVQVKISIKVLSEENIK